MWHRVYVVLFFSSLMIAHRTRGLESCVVLTMMCAMVKLYIYIIIYMYTFLWPRYGNNITTIMKDGKSRFMMIRGWRTKPWFIAVRVCISRGNSNNNNDDDDDDGDDDDDYNSNICVYIAFCARRIFVPRLYSHPRGQLQRAFCNRFLSLSPSFSLSKLHYSKI